MQFLLLSWDEIVSHLMNVAEQIRARSDKPDLIIGIARGGLSVAHILSDLLSLPVASFTVSSYHELKRKDTLTLTYGIGGKLNGKHVLLVDDVSDSGRTFVRAKKYLCKNGAEKITTAAVFTKPQSAYTPDAFAAKTDHWIIFPFDLFESIRDIKTRWRKEGMDETMISQRFVEMGIPVLYLTLLDRLARAE